MKNWRSKIIILKEAFASVDVLETHHPVPPHLQGIVERFALYDQCVVPCLEH